MLSKIQRPSAKGQAENRRAVARPKAKEDRTRMKKRDYESLLAPYLYAHHTEHALISETPSEWPLAVRAKAHLRVLEVVLQRRLGA